MEETHKKTNGIGHNSNILKDKSPTAEAIEEQLFKVGEIINDITGKLFRVEEEYRGAKGDEIVVNPYERPDDDPLGSTRVYRKPTPYEKHELHFEAQKGLKDVNNRLTHLHLNIDNFINGDIKEVNDKYQRGRPSDKFVPYPYLSFAVQYKFLHQNGRCFLSFV